MKELGIGPHAVGGVLRAKLLQAARYLDGTCIQQLHPGVVLKGGQRPQGVGQLLGGVLGQGLNSPVHRGLQDQPSWIVAQLSIGPQAVGHCLQAKHMPMGWVRVPPSEKVCGACADFWEGGQKSTGLRELQPLPC